MTRPVLSFPPFRPQHLDGLPLWDGQAEVRPFLGQPGYAEGLQVPGLSWSAELEGEIVGCAGILRLHQGTGRCWALIGANMPRAGFIQAHNRVKHALEAANAMGMWRLETTVDSRHRNNHRWALKLGFINETPNGMAAYSHLGTSHCLYARVCFETLRRAQAAQTEQAA